MKRTKLPRSSGSSLGDVFTEADPQLAQFMARHNALLERVTKLERALEETQEIVDDDWLSREARTGMHPRAEIREVIGVVLDG